MNSMETIGFITEHTKLTTKHCRMKNEQDKGGQGPYHCLRTGSSSSPPNTQIRHLPQPQPSAPLGTSLELKMTRDGGLVEQAEDTFLA